MKGKSLLAVLVIVAILFVGTVFAAAFILKNNTGFSLEKDSDSVTEIVRLNNMLPGDSRSHEHTADAESFATFSVSLEEGGENALNPYLSVKLVVNDETLFEGSVEEFLAKEKIEKELNGKFTFSVIYTLPESVGNEAQGKASELKMIYSLKSGIST